MHALVYCKTIIVSIPSILSIRASGTKYSVSMAKYTISDDVILFIEHVVSSCACALDDITKYFKQAEVVQLPEGKVFQSSKYCCT